MYSLARPFLFSLDAERAHGLGLAALAVALALLVGHNNATLTLFWPPYRFDVSFNFVVFCLIAGFALVAVVLSCLRPGFGELAPAKQRTLTALRLLAVALLLLAMIGCSPREPKNDSSCFTVAF